MSATRLLTILLAMLTWVDLPAKPRVFIFTDINIDAGDPDDRQSLVHLFWYADELEIAGIVPDRWEARGLEACNAVVDAFARDHARYRLDQYGYPAPDHLRRLIAPDREQAIARFAAAATASAEPLWVLVWGNMDLFGQALREHPELISRLRVITIGTGLMYEPDLQHLPAHWEKLPPCEQPNWNGAGRNTLWADPRFRGLWWLELNWTYNGMFSGDEPKAMFDQLAVYGALGQHLQEVTANEPWARYFRVGDTPSVLHVIDPRPNPEDPTRARWSGRFRQPFPSERPHYFTDDCGAVEWDYADPCRTWAHHPRVFDHSKGTLEAERPAMYRALLDKLDRVYRLKGPPPQLGRPSAPGMKTLARAAPVRCTERRAAARERCEWLWHF